MSEEMKPYVVENKTDKILEIIEQTEREFGNDVKISVGEAKRIELIRKMKEDTDKQEYMIMFNVLMLSLAVVSLGHFVLFSTIVSLVSVVLCLGYFVYTRKRLTTATLKLADYKNNFDKYLWEGFFLKEMRYSAVKLAYLIFFPLLVVFLTDIFTYSDERITLWLGILVAIVISSIGWLIFFAEDKSALESIESDLKSLEYL